MIPSKTVGGISRICGSFGFSPSMRSAFSRTRPVERDSCSSLTISSSPVVLIADCTAEQIGQGLPKVLSVQTYTAFSSPA